MIKSRSAILLFLSSLFFMACSTTPTGRQQINFMSDDQMASMGEQSFAEMKKQQKISKDPRTNQYVQCVARQVLSVVPTEIKDWEIVVFEEPSANAFALPGGKIGVHTGILKVAKNADQLAAVLGHEVAHVIANHGSERVSQSVLTQTTMQAAQIALNAKTQNGQMLMAALGLGAQYGILLPYGRKQESEADEIGLQYMAEAGFDPSQAVALWHNMASQGSGQPPEFLSTHPSNENRIQKLTQLQPSALNLRNSALSKGIKPNCGTL